MVSALVAAGTLDALSSRTRIPTLYVSLYLTDSNRSLEYLKKLDASVSQIEQIIGI
jgi:hypothetical protein